MVAPTTYARRLLGALLVALAALTLACSDTPSTPTDATSTTGATGATIEAFRYRLSFELEGTDQPFSVVQSGEVVLPDREHSLLVMETGALTHESERVAIGDREWVRGDLPWVDLAMSPLEYLGGAAETDRLAGLDFVDDTIDGIPTRRYELDADTLRQLVDNDDLVNPDGALDATLWVSSEFGIPIRLVVVGGSGDSGDSGELRLTIEVYDVNATDIEIDEPEVSARQPRPEGAMQS